MGPGSISTTNTNGAGFVFDSTILPGSGGQSMASIFGEQGQFGLSVIFPIGNSTPQHAVAYNGPGNTPIDQGPVSWAINGYNGSPGAPNHTPRNSLFYGGNGTTSNPGVIVAHQTHVNNMPHLDGTLISDGIIHWYNTANPDTSLNASGLSNNIRFSAALTYLSTDTTTGVVYYKGDITLSLQAVPEPATLVSCGSAALVLGGLGWYRRRKRTA